MVVMMMLLLVPPGAAITVAADDSVFPRSGRKCTARPGSMTGPPPARNKLRFGTCFVTCGIIVRLPSCSRLVCLPVLARLHVPGKGTARKPRRQTAPASTVSCAVALVAQLAAAFPGRRIDVVADAHHHGPALRDLPQNVTWTTRLPKNAVLYAPGPAPGPQARLAAAQGAPAWPPVGAGRRRVLGTGNRHIYRRDQARELAEITCLWYGCLDTRTARVILARDAVTTLALVTTDLHASPAALTERYAAPVGHRAGIL